MLDWIFICKYQVQRVLPKLVYITTSNMLISLLQINEADGAFYGPKIDITVYDALKRKFQCATIQVSIGLNFGPTKVCVLCYHIGNGFRLLV